MIEFSLESLALAPAPNDYDQEDADHDEQQADCRKGTDLGRRPEMVGGRASVLASFYAERRIVPTIENSR